MLYDVDMKPTLDQKHISETLETLDSIRQLSFSIHEKDTSLKLQNTRIERLIREVQETMDLKTVYDTRSNELQNKLEQIKTLALSTK